MKTRILITGSCLALCFLMTGIMGIAQETSNYSEVQIEKPFVAVEAGSVYKVILQQGETQKVRFESPEDLEGKVFAEVDGTTLSFGAKGINPKKLTITVYYVNLERLETTGAASVEGMSPVRGEKFELEASGASKVTLQLEVKNLISEVDGAAEVKLSGKAAYHRTEVSGAANLKAWELETDKANVEVSGAASARLNVKEEIKGESSGVGKIILKGEPAVKNIEKSGVSKVYTGEAPDDSSEVTRIELEGNRVMTIDENGIVIESDSGDVEPLIINDEGVRVVIKEKSKDGTKETKVLIINEDGVKIEKKEKKDSGFHIGGKKGNKFNGHWDGFDLGVNGYLNADGNMDMPKGWDFLDLRMEKSINVKVNFFEQNVNLINNHFGLVTGLGLEYCNYRFDNNVRIDTEDGQLVGGYDTDPDRSYQKSKLVVNYLNLPLLLEYQTNNKNKINSFHLTAGMTAGLRIGSHTKVVYTSGKDNKDKERDDFYLNPFKWDATARVGWGVLNLTANYSLAALFKDNKGPELYPFSLGITLTDF